ncbi:MAG: Ig-like domain-containing protein, partial [Bacteroidales bacterium]
PIDKNVLYISSNPAVIKVSENGTITALSSGEASIIVQGTGTSTITKIINFTVLKPKVCVESIKLVTNKSSLTTGSTATIDVIITPENATNKQVQWEVSSNSIILTPNGIESATVLANQLDNYLSVYAIAKDECKALSNSLSYSIINPSTQIPITGIEPLKPIIYVDNGNTTLIVVNYQPFNTTQTGLVYTSADTSIATVENGMVTGRNFGTTTITVSSLDNPTIKTTIQVNVIKYIQSIELSYLSQKDEVKVKTGQLFTMDAMILPTDAGNRKLQWTTSNPHVAEINPNTGVILAKIPGSAQITATSTDGSFVSDVITVIVEKIQATSITIDGGAKSKTLNLEQEYSFSIKVLPENTTYQTTSLSVVNSNILEVVDNKTIKAIGVGTTTVTIQSVDNPTVKSTIEIIVLADKKALQDAIKKAENVLNQIKTVLPENVVREYQMLIEDAKDVVASNASTQELVNEYLDNLKAKTVQMEQQLAKVSVEIVLNTDITVSPNPATSYIIVKSDVLMHSITIVSSTGKKVITRTKLSDMKQTIDVTDFTSGIYTIIVETNTGISALKFAKQ